ncbi:hypothetical protein SCA6_001464 [Theobroma cacao]
MFFKKLLLLFLWIKVATSSNQGFIFNGFSLQLVSGQEQSLELGGIAELRTDGLFRLTDSSTFQVGHVFYSVPFKFKSSPNANAFSFSTTFVFVIVPENSRGHGITFVLAPSKEFGQVAPGQHLGLFNFSTDGLSSNHIVAIEFDTFQNQEFADMDDNHVGVDINSLKSAKSVSAGYVYSKTGKYRPADLSCGDRMQVWVEYDGTKHQLNVTLSPVIRRSKPKVPLLSMDIDLSPIILEQMYIGFSSATGLQVASTYISGWSFQMDGVAKDLDLDKLPSVTRSRKKKSRKKEIIVAVAVPVVGVLLLAVVFSAICFLSRKKDRFTEILEDWEVQFGPHSKHAQETIHLAGTYGYIAPELAKTGRANTSTDVYAFGAFCLEVVCGRRPLMPRASAEEVHLVDWVFNCWNEGDILKTADPELNKDFAAEEIDLVLKLALLCSHTIAAYRPRMSQVISYLNGQASLPEDLDKILHTQELLEQSRDYSLTWTKDSLATMAVTESFLFAGR